ncbi:hypothetical protein BH24ACT4_BH24ACT4_18630 [soil metagenome]
MIAHLALTDALTQLGTLIRAGALDAGTDGPP